MARSLALALCTVLSLSGCGYSSLQQQDEDVKASWSEVVSLYQRRADLIAGRKPAIPMDGLLMT